MVELVDSEHDHAAHVVPVCFQGANSPVFHALGSVHPLLRTGLMLRELMNKAGQEMGGAVVNVLAYKADHVAASEELRVLESAARSKNCETPANWRSNSSIR